MNYDAYAKQRSRVAPLVKSATDESDPQDK
jgi:hypothetical protein